MLKPNNQQHQESTLVCNEIVIFAPSWSILSNKPHSILNQNDHNWPKFAYFTECFWSGQISHGFFRMVQLRKWKWIDRIHQIRFDIVLGQSWGFTSTAGSNSEQKSTKVHSHNFYQFFKYFFPRVPFVYFYKIRAAPAHIQIEKSQLTRIQPENSIKVD